VYRPTTMDTINWQMLFRDLIAFAPGMDTSMTDIFATLEAEASDQTTPKQGRIDDAARRLIERSRSGGWRTHVIGDGKFSITYDGAGRFVFSRTRPTGLRETVVNDGQALLHLYPEIGVGARRVMSRAHRAEFEAMLPGSLPPVEDLARGADVIAMD